MRSLSGTEAIDVGGERTRTQGICASEDDRTTMISVQQHDARGLLQEMHLRDGGKQDPLKEVDTELGSRTGGDPPGGPNSERPLAGIASAK